MSIEYLANNFIEHKVTKGGRVITTDHAQIHKGYGNSLFNRTSLTNGSSASVVITTPASDDTTFPYVHLKVYNGNISGDGYVELIEDVGTPSTTSSITITNRNRNLASHKPSNVSAVFTTSSITGTVVEGLAIGGGGTGAAASKGVNSLDVEYVLKPATRYGLRLTNQSGTTKTCDWFLFWYEEAYYGGE